MLKLKPVQQVEVVFGTTQYSVEDVLYTKGKAGVQKIVWADPMENKGVKFCKVYLEDEVIFISNPTRVWYNINN